MVRWPWSPSARSRSAAPSEPGASSSVRSSATGARSAEVENRLGELPRRRVRPVHVLERDDDRLLSRQRLEPADVRLPNLLGASCVRRSPRLGAAGAARALGARRRARSPKQRPELRPGLRPNGDLGLADLGAEPAEQRFDERPRDEAAVGEAVAFEPRDAILRQSPRSSARRRVLPIPGSPTQQDDCGRARRRARRAHP